MEPSNFHPKTLQPVLQKYIHRLFEIEFLTFFSRTNLLSRTYRKVSGKQYQGQQNIQNC